MITNAQKINYKYLSLCPLTVLLPRRLPCSPICTCRSPVSVRVALCTCCAPVRNKTHDTEALVRACSAWAVRGSKNTQICCSERMSETGYCLYRPLTVQITPGLPTVTVFYSRGRIPRKTVRWWRWWPHHRGCISLPRWSGNCCYRHSPSCHMLFS